MSDWNKMNLRPAHSFFAALLFLAACASTNFQAYEGRGGPKAVEGEGGTKEVIDSYELWGSGTPPRRYQILGMTEIVDFDNFLGNRRIRAALVDQIKAAGGDAAIVMDTSGGGQMVGMALGSGGTVTPAVGFGKKSNRYQIVKYLDKQ